MPRSLFMSDPSGDDDLTFYTITVDFPAGPSVLGLVVDSEGNLAVNCWPDGGTTSTRMGTIELPAPNDSVLRAAFDRAVAALPDKIDLVYIDRDHQLSDTQIQALFEGGDLFEDDDRFDEWMSDQLYDNAVSTIKEYVDAEDLALVEQDASLIDELRFVVQERDSSTPFEDLVRNTSHRWIRYKLDVDTTSVWSSDEDQILAEMGAIAEAAGIEQNDENMAVLRNLVTEAGGGAAYVFWYGDVDDLITAVGRIDADEEPIPQTITWERPELLILDSYNGAGYSTVFPGKITLPFNRDNLTLDAQGIGFGYSWREVAGLASPRETTNVTITVNSAA